MLFGKDFEDYYRSSLRISKIITDSVYETQQTRLPESTNGVFDVCGAHTDRLYLQDVKLTLRNPVILSGDSGRSITQADVGVADDDFGLWFLAVGGEEFHLHLFQRR